MTLSLPGKNAALGMRRVKLVADQAGAVPVNSEGRMARARPASTNRPVSSIQPLAGSGTVGGPLLGVKVINMEYRPTSH